MHICGQIVIIFERKQILQWNLQNMWSESSSVSIVNLEKKIVQFQRYQIFPRGYFFGAPCIAIVTQNLSVATAALASGCN